MNSTINPPEDHLQWNAQEVSSIIVIFSLFLILSYYSVVRPICCRTSSSRSLQAHHQRRHLLEDSTIDEFQSHGLEMSVIQSLPISRFKKKKSEEGEDDEKVNSNNNTDCAICLGEFEEGERLKHLPNCNHVFHVLCIDSWFRCHSDCPLCRSHVHLGDDDGNLTSINLECSIDSYTLMETLRREDFSQERTSHHHHHHHHQFIHSETSGD